MFTFLRGIPQGQTPDLLQNGHPKTPQCTTLEHGREREPEDADHDREGLRRREVPNFALPRINFIPLFYRVLEKILLTPFLTPYEISPVKVFSAYFPAPEEGHGDRLLHGERGLRPGGGPHEAARLRDARVGRGRRRDGEEDNSSGTAGSK